MQSLRLSFSQVSDRLLPVFPRLSGLQRGVPQAPHPAETRRNPGRPEAAQNPGNQHPAGGEQAVRGRDRLLRIRVQPRGTVRERGDQPTAGPQRSSPSGSEA